MRFWKRRLGFFLILTLTLVFGIAMATTAKRAEIDRLAQGKEYIKWVDFDVTAEAMNDAMAVDLATYGTEKHISWIDLLACLGARYGGAFSGYRKAHLTRLVDRMTEGESLESITADLPHFPYFREAYGAVLEGYVGEYWFDGEKRYGLCAFSPLAKGFAYDHYDDFGASRSYGYHRSHLGHDLMGSIGTPVIAIESGYVEAIGWNQYGGWRIGIRSFDQKRYYYYAHLRKDHPYAGDLSEGDIVTAGDVIGYLGMTGYSHTENVNNINVPHLHFGVQLIFNASQKDGNNQIWINCYELTKFLSQNCMPVVTDTETKERLPAHSLFIPSIPD